MGVKDDECFKVISLEMLCNMVVVGVGIILLFELVLFEDKIKDGVCYLWVVNLILLC